MFHYYLASSMTDWAQIFTDSLFYAYVGINQVNTGLRQLPKLSSAFNILLSQPSWISPTDINVTKPRREEHSSLVPIRKMIILAFIIVIRYEERDQDGGSMIKVYCSLALHRPLRNPTTSSLPKYKIRKNWRPWAQTAAHQVDVKKHRRRIEITCWQKSSKE